jgi:hypothetical protein
MWEAKFHRYDNGCRDLQSNRRGGAVTRPFLIWHADCLSNAVLNSSEENPMLWTTFVTILLVWCLGLVTSVTLSGFIHLLPFMAAVVAVIGSIQSRGII